MKVEISVPEVAEVFKVIQEHPARLLEMVRTDIREAVGRYLSEMMAVELTDFLGREPYERDPGKPNHRNGSYPRSFALKGIGEVDVRVPRDRQGEYRTIVLPRSKRYEDQLRQDIALMFLSGVSTRTLSMISGKLIGRKISPAEVSRATGELIEAAESWRTRDLSQERFKYLFCDGVFFEMRVSRTIERIPVLVVIGVTEGNGRQVVALQSGDKESASSWREVFKDLKSRGMNGQAVTLGVMDGLAGLEKVFREEFPRSKVQRCQVHVRRNVMAKVPRKLREAVGDEIRSIFYATNRKRALELFMRFKERWQRDIPSAVKCLENSLEACLTFFSFPDEEWISLRTTNIIERLNKEFKRRTKSMEILAGESACYTLLAFICIKMELHWRSNPIGKVHYNLPSLRSLIEGNFTQ